VRAGQPVVASDLAEPTLVNRNDGVTLTCETPGMVLTVRAKALDAGAEGDTIAVLNAQSNRVVQATVTGPGRVAVLVGAPAALN
jgi:flagella basal body P-ring formation protein FlgA